MPRLIGTGSRAFIDYALVRGVLAEQSAQYGPSLVVVEGEAAGADQLIKRAARSLGLELDPFPADWGGACRATCRPRHRRPGHGGSTYCPAAGDYRNQAMVDAGAQVCVAFLVPPSVSPCKGTRDCMRRAEAAGIPVHCYTQEGR